MRLAAIPGTLSTPADEGDVGITTSLTDVRLASNLTDYTGELQTVLNADTLVPGSVKENLRTTWQLGQVQVYDGGSDGLASTTGDNTLFETQGVFVP